MVGVVRFLNWLVLINQLALDCSFKAASAIKSGQVFKSRKYNFYSNDTGVLVASGWPMYVT